MASEYVITQFNREVKRAIDDTIGRVLGEQLLRSVYDHLEQHYDISADEIPYRLATLFDTLENTTGFNDASVLSHMIARRVYAQMGLRFIELPNYQLQDYVERAKIGVPLRCPWNHAEGHLDYEYGNQSVAYPAVHHEVLSVSQ